MTTTPFQGPVLITGCSTGIGHATALRLLAEGVPVVATARRPETLADLGRQGAVTLALDVTDAHSREAAVDQVIERFGGVGALVNNAGYGLIGPVETVPIDEFRRQFETNVVGLVAMTQLVLPAMRDAGGGRVVNVGSMGGQVVFPFAGSYHATKYAVEALSDALRLELKAFGVQVTLIEPAGVATEFEATSNQALHVSQDSPYAPVMARFQATAARFQAPDAPGMLTADDVAGHITRALLARRAPTRVKVGSVAKVTTLARRLTPDRTRDAALTRAFGV